MSDRRRVFILVLIMLTVALVGTGIAITLLYQAALSEEKERLVETAQSQARLIESIARFDAIYSQNYPGGEVEATLRQIRDAQENYQGFGQTGEFTLGRLEGDLIIFLLRHRHLDTELPQPVPFESELAEPMRFALLNQSGTMIGLDYRGETVLAAYEPVAVLDLGIVAKIDLVEIQAPFIRAGSIAGAATLTIVLLGALLFLRITDPLLKNIIESEERLSSFMDAATEAFYLFDKDLNYTMINQSGMFIFPPGTRQEDLIGMNLLDIVPSLKETELYDEYLKVMRTGEPYLTDDVVPDPQFGDLHLAIRAFKVGDGMGIVMLDVTEKVRMENKLLLRSQIMSHMEEGVFLVRAEDEVIVYNNPAFEKIYGYAPDEMLGKHVSIVNAPTEKKPEETAKEINAMIEKEGGWEGEIRNIRKDGTPFWSYANISSFNHSEHGTVWISVQTDITKRMKVEEEKRKMEMLLRQQQKLESIGTLASGVAHEINNPITGIMNYAQLIHDRLDSSEGQLREFSTGIIEETERVATIVRNLLTFSRQEKQSHNPACITDIVNDTLSLVGSIFRRDQITLEVDIPDDLPRLKCRSQQIQQVLMNLLTNSRDALNQRYPEYDPNKIISVSVRLLKKDGQRWLRTTVEDHGAGISREIQERIFDPFYTTKDRALGTGLGLSISLGIVQDHHGELTFESEDGQPTCFHLDLPVDNGWSL